MLQFAARRFFAPQAIVSERKEGMTRIAIISDATRPLPARWRVRSFAMDGRLLGERSGGITLAPLSATDVAKLSDETLFGAADPRASYAAAELIVAGKIVSRALVERDEPKDMAYPPPGLTARWSGKTLTLTATNLARAVMIGFGTIVATPSDNGFDLLPGESITVTIESDADAATLQHALMVRTLGPA